MNNYDLFSITNRTFVSPEIPIIHFQFSIINYNLTLVSSFLRKFTGINRLWNVFCKQPIPWPPENTYPESRPLNIPAAHKKHLNREQFASSFVSDGHL
jgi:hypothetical protein